MEARELLFGLVLVWLAAKAMGEAMERIGQPAILGELLAGVIIGPGVLGLVRESYARHALAELGVLILLLRSASSLTSVSCCAQDSKRRSWRWSVSLVAYRTPPRGPPWCRRRGRHPRLDHLGRCYRPVTDRKFSLVGIGLLSGKAIVLLVLAIGVGIR
jgi:hypothetical protein